MAGQTRRRGKISEGARSTKREAKNGAFGGPGQRRGVPPRADRQSQPGRIKMTKGEAPALPPITVPTCIRWAEHDPLFPYAWTDRLNETFANLDLKMFPGVGHFPHREDPDRASEEIAAFFQRIDWI